MRVKTISFILFLLSFTAQAQKIKLSRICNDGNNNTISWQIHADTLTLLNPLYLWASDAISTPYFTIDSTIISGAKSYIHIDANVPSTKDWKYFIRYRAIHGADTFWLNTDTVKVDTDKPDSTILDSVSVDPITGVVYLGWTSNKTPDFSSYYLYNYDRADPRLQENYKDTFYTDLTPINPSSKSLSYDITSADSCNNRKEYGQYKHMTICLKATIDTCSGIVTLNWNSYTGWPTRMHEIYRSVNGSSFQFLDSTNALVYVDKDILSNSLYQYFVRARKADPFKNISSTSNGSAKLNSGISVAPRQTQINVVTNNNNGQIEVSLLKNPTSDYGGVDLWRTDELGNPSNKIYRFSPTELNYLDLSAVNTVTNHYVVMGINVCGQVSDTSAVSHNIVLAIEEYSSDYRLKWGRYSTWNNGVENYTIYRSSGTSVENLMPYWAYGSLNDTNEVILKDDTAAHCYYILAKENTKANYSKSNIVCIIKSDQIYYPNAIVIGGINNVFTFIGEGIELNKSVLQVYDRWGGLVFSKENIVGGWPGINMNGEEVQGGVYFFTAKVYQGNDYIDLHGNITVLK